MSIVLTEDRGPVRHVVLNRPEKRNAMNQELLAALADALRAAAHDASVHCVVLRGEGPCSPPAWTSASSPRSPANRACCARSAACSSTARTSAKRCPSPSSARSTAPVSAARWRSRSAATCGSPPTTLSSACPRSSSGSSPTSAAPRACPRVVGLGRAKELIMTGAIDRRHRGASASASSTASSPPRSWTRPPRRSWTSCSRTRTLRSAAPSA